MADTRHAGTHFIVKDMVIEVFPGDGTPSTVLPLVVTSTRTTKDGDFATGSHYGITDFGTVVKIGYTGGWADEFGEVTEEDLKSKGSFAIYSASGNGYPREYFTETWDFGGLCAFGQKVFTSPGVAGETHARSTSYHAAANCSVHFATPVVMLDIEASDDKREVIKLKFAVLDSADGKALTSFADTLEVDLDQTFPLVQFDYSFYNGLAHGLRGVGTPVFEPSTSFEKGYVAGADLRNHRDAKIPKYHYNEMECVDFSWLYGNYPYAVMCGWPDAVAKEGGSGGYNLRTLFLSYTPIYAVNGKSLGMDSIMLEGVRGSLRLEFKYGEENWTEKGVYESDKYYYDIRDYEMSETWKPRVMWANHDIVNADTGEIVQAASTPILV